MTLRANPVHAILPPARPARLGGILHAGVLLATLLVCLVLPRNGQGVLLVPLAPRPATVLPRDIGWTGLALLGRGPLPGSLLVRPAGPVPLLALLRQGVVPIAVPLAVCGRDGTNRPGAGPNPSRDKRSPWTN
ncbi:hypothetical protein [Novosphingobium sp.]|uniref:hypothetical protein n=1 Tax=Novosphingobium sp. TaxID=1874826 RepID=UPI0026346192|nr:hypothetical protein [Novosphingobium sp.]